MKTIPKLKWIIFLGVVLISSRVEGSLSDFINPGASLSLSDIILFDENPGDKSGWSLASAGDVDGDGLSDILIGAPNYPGIGSSTGVVYLILGKTICRYGRSLQLADADYKFVGDVDDRNVGYSVSSAGDVDGDGLSDILIGAPDRFYHTGAFQNGTVYVILGRSLSHFSTVTSLSRANYILKGENPDDKAGYSVSNVTDIDGDGRNEILIGAPGYNHQGGAAYLLMSRQLGRSRLIPLSTANYIFLGRFYQSPLMPSYQTFGLFGSSVAGVGDMNGDGQGDFAIAHPTAGSSIVLRGHVSLFLSPLPSPGIYSAGNDDFSFAEFKGQDFELSRNGYDQAESIVSGLGDLNGDGYSDFCYSSPGNRPSLVTLVYGGSFQTSNLGGTQAVGIGDIDGDGRSDLLALASGNLPTSSPSLGGRAYLVPGRNLEPGRNSLPTWFVGRDGRDIALPFASHIFLSEALPSYGGEVSNISPAGDVDGDGLPDLLIGSLNHGCTYLILSAGIATVRPRPLDIIYYRPLVFPDDIDPRPWPMAKEKMNFYVNDQNQNALENVVNEKQLEEVKQSVK